MTAEMFVLLLLLFDTTIEKYNLQFENKIFWFMMFTKVLASFGELTKTLPSQNPSKICLFFK